MAKTPKSKPAVPKKIFIVEDHPVFRDGLVQIVQSEGDLVVCGEAETAEKALPAIRRLKPDLVVVDITLPGKSGLELLKELRALDRKVKLLVVSMHDEALYADRVLRAGGDGYIMKQEDPDEIVHAIRDVLEGHVYVSEQVLAASSETTPRRPLEPRVRALTELTDAELEVLGLLGWGKTNQEIARQLRLSVSEVIAHCSHIKGKLKLKNSNELIRYAVCWVENGGKAG